MTDHSEMAFAKAQLAKVEANETDAVPTPEPRITVVIQTPRVAAAVGPEAATAIAIRDYLQEALGEPVHLSILERVEESRMPQRDEG
jgi:ribosomal protein S3